MTVSAVSVGHARNALQGGLDAAHVVDGTLRLEGWAFDADSRRPSNLVVQVDGRVLAGTVGLSRPDVAQALGDPRAQASGFALRVPLVRRDPRPRVDLRAISPSGLQTLLYQGWPLGEPQAEASGAVPALEMRQRSPASLFLALLPPQTARVLELDLGADGIAADLRRHGCRVDRSADVDRLVDAEGDCDAVLCDLTLSAPRDLPRLLTACARRLRPGGVLLVAATDAGYRAQVQQQLGPGVAAAVDQLQPAGPAWAGTSASVGALLQQVGLAVERVEPIGPATADDVGAPGLLGTPDRFVISARLPLRAPAIGHAARQPHDDTVEVVVPVHNALDAVQRCLASLLQAEPQRRWQLTLIDDASTDPAVAPALRRLAQDHPAVRVLHNAVNRGYAGTTNLGMRLAGRRDVILLNSDAVVPPGWIGRLRRAAYSAERVGTVTPFSNNASICSFPRLCEANALPDGIDALALDALFDHHLAGQTLEIPTAVGFCLYLRRDCLDDVGLFDEGIFGAGYGEEDDFCMRARARGWRHLHALDLFVPHEGGVSFGPRRLALQEQAIATLRLRYPFYEDLVHPFIRQDPARPARDAVLHQLATLLAARPLSPT